MATQPTNLARQINLDDIGRDSMSASEQTAESVAATPTEQFDVIIIGAGISGVNAAYRIAQRNPGMKYVLLERRADIGGTWDLFRYPGVRSDSSIFTLAFPFEPWTRKESIADGPDIRQYIVETAKNNHIDGHIRFNTYVRSANWDSTTDNWTLRADVDGCSKRYCARYVFFGTGYYNHDRGYTPEFPGIGQYQGLTVHPQHWPTNLDYTGRRIVVIGSGATAVSMVPSLAQRASEVVMLQRSPSYVLPVPRVDAVTELIRKLLPHRWAHQIARSIYTALEILLWHVARSAPNLFKGMLRHKAIVNLPRGYDVDTHFGPRYAPWDQRMCFIPDMDLYVAIRQGHVRMETDSIDYFDASGIVLKSGAHISADIVVTATGVELQAFGGVILSIDGTAIATHDRFTYKAYMLEGVPNMGWCIGQINASWTLRADQSSIAFAKLLKYMSKRRYTSAYPDRNGEAVGEKSILPLDSGYIRRSVDSFPKSGIKRPWDVRQNHIADAIEHRFSSIKQAMVFGPAPRRSSAGGAAGVSGSNHLLTHRAKRKLKAVLARTPAGAHGPRVARMVPRRPALLTLVSWSVHRRGMNPHQG
jgi:cation diffusion facilitator CzcD-associated flavoprotein CzcO